MHVLIEIYALSRSDLEPFLGQISFQTNTRFDGLRHYDGFGINRKFGTMGRLQIKYSSRINSDFESQVLDSDFLHPGLSPMAIFQLKG